MRLVGLSLSTSKEEEREKGENHERCHTTDYTADDSTYVTALGRTCTIRATP